MRTSRYNSFRPQFIIHILIHTPYAGEQDCKQVTEIFLKFTYFDTFYRLEPQRGVCLETQINWWQNSSNLTSPLCKWVMTQKMPTSQWTADHLTTLDYKSKQIEFLTVTFVWIFSWSTGVLVFHHRIMKFPNDYYKMEKILSEEEKQRINALLEKHWPRAETKEKEMVVLSEKGR